MELQRYHIHPKYLICTFKDVYLIEEIYELLSVFVSPLQLIQSLKFPLFILLSFLLSVCLSVSLCVCRAVGLSQLLTFFSLNRYAIYTRLTSHEMLATCWFLGQYVNVIRVVQNILVSDLWSRAFASYLVQMQPMIRRCVAHHFQGPLLLTWFDRYYVINK